MSGYRDIEEKAKAAGAVAVMRKPIHPADPSSVGSRDTRGAGAALRALRTAGYERTESCFRIVKRS
jgi:hypothetical protein